MNRFDFGVYQPSNIPGPIKAGLDRYSEHGIRPGDCLFAILCGDLFMAFARADPTTTHAMPAIVAWISTHLPEEAWGNSAHVESWIAAGLDKRRKLLAESVL